MTKYLLAILCLSALQTAIFARNTTSPDTLSREIKPKFSVYEGIVIVGYTDNGGFLNFTGPNLNASFKHHKIILGMMPSLRFKEDHSTIRNSFVMPSLGAGLTYCYKKFAIQIPLYYNAKTDTENGRWRIGIGIGIRFM